MDNSSLAHPKWKCKYHIVFALKCCSQVICKDIKVDAGQILRTFHKCTDCHLGNLQFIMYRKIWDIFYISE